MTDKSHEPDAAWLQAYEATHTRLQTIVDALRVIEQARAHNPDADEARALDAKAAELAEERVRCNAELTALTAGSTTLTPPGERERALIAELCAQVQSQANSALAASQAIALCTRVLATLRTAAGGSEAS